MAPTSLVPPVQYDTYIISDLHLSNGYSPYSGRYDPREDFFYDLEFAELLRHLASRLQQGFEGDAEGPSRPVRLILLGDVFEMLQVDGMPEPDEPAYQDSEVQETLREGKVYYGLSTSPIATEWRLKEIAKGHPLWFEALGDLLALDPLSRIDVVVGNHDIEMVWEQAQRCFRKLVARYSKHEAIRDSQALAERIRFYPWFIYEPGFFYAEHGHQYDDLNSFATLLRPVLPSNPGLIELPLGSFFVRYIFNRIERFAYFSDNVRPITRYITWALRHHPVQGLATLFYHMRFFLRMLRKASSLSEEEQRRRRERYWHEVLRPFAQANYAEMRLSAEQVIALDQLAVLPSTHSRWSQFVKLVFDPLKPALLWLAPLSVVFTALRRAQRAVRNLLTVVAGLLLLIWRERNVFLPAVEPRSALRDVARAIDEIVRREDGSGALFYVFGHSHVAEIYPLGKDNLPRYINSGTWTPIIDPDAQLVRDVTQLNVVRLLQRDDGSATGELLQWNPEARRLQRVVLI